jgi:hypothetical protein
MTNCPLYNGQNIVFTGTKNPYALIQSAGKRKSRKSRKSNKTIRKRNNVRRSRKYRR